MANLSDVLTAAQNIVKAINQAATTYQDVQGSTNSAAISVAAVLKTSGGRLARVSVTTAGSSPGVIYDGAATTATSRPVYEIPNTVGVFEINLAMNYGIYVVPGSGGQIVTVGYS